MKEKFIARVFLGFYKHQTETSPLARTFKVEDKETCRILDERMRANLNRVLDLNDMSYLLYTFPSEKGKKKVPRIDE